MKCLERRLMTSRPDETRKSSTERPAGLRGSEPQRGCGRLHPGRQGGGNKREAGGSQQRGLRAQGG